MEHEKHKVGSVHSTNKYGDFIITKYVNASNVHIKFLNTGYETVTLNSCILSGEIRDRYFPSVHEYFLQVRKLKKHSVMCAEMK